jgi:hypothetical protein
MPLYDVMTIPIQRKRHSTGAQTPPPHPRGFVPTACQFPMRCLSSCNDVLLRYDFPNHPRQQAMNFPEEDTVSGLTNAVWAQVRDVVPGIASDMLAKQIGHGHRITYQTYRTSPHN